MEICTSVTNIQERHLRIYTNTKMKTRMGIADLTETGKGDDKTVLQGESRCSVRLFHIKFTVKDVEKELLKLKANLYDQFHRRMLREMTPVLKAPLSIL